jgi:protein TonB
MSPHVDILEQSEHLGRPFVGSIVFHSALAVLVAGATWVQNRDSLRLGSPGGGRPGAVLVTPSSIPIPNSGGPINPVANPTKSQLPTPPEKKAPPKSSPKAPDPNAVALPSKNAPPKKPSWYTEPNDKFRKAQKFEPNQLYSTAGRPLSNPNMQVPGTGGIGLSGTNSPFGSQFGAYAELLIQQVARVWNKPALTTNNSPQATVSFTLRRDGSVVDVKITQRSGLPALDFSAQRAILDAAPFPPFPPGLNKAEAGIDFVFELKR